MIRIFSDSTCDLSKELIERYGITILPLHVHLDEEEYLDGVNITPDELYTWSDANKKTPKTSAISIAETMDEFKSAVDAGDEIIVFSISSFMSSSCNNMILAAEEIDAEDKISVIDSGNLSTGIGLLVVEAAEMVLKGMARADIVEEIERLKPLVRASFVVDTLTYLHRGGRCKGVAAFAGTVLKLHPKIYVEGGEMKVGKKYRGKYNKVVLDYAKEMEAEILSGKADRIFITHSGIDHGICDSVKNYLEGLGYYKDVIVTRAGSVISSHCGYGTLGVLFIANE